MISIRHIIVFLFLLLPFTSQAHTVFMVSGELSGDRLGGWYLNQLNKKHKNVKCTAIGGNNIKKNGGRILHHYSKLTIGFVGPIAFVKRLKKIYKIYDKITSLLDHHQFDEVVLVDSPFINLPLLFHIKKHCPKTKITYVAPHELWFWGCWWIDSILRNKCDEIVVLYPFEKEWYKNHEVETSFHGYPFYGKFTPFFDASKKKKNQIAFLIGSRPSTVKMTLPLYAEVIRLLQNTYPELTMLIPVAESISLDYVKTTFKELFCDIKRMKFTQNENEKYKELAHSCLAVTFPGTVTLELALLKTPTIVTCKLPFLSYWLSRIVVQQEFVALPNILMNKELFRELIQDDCNEDTILKEVQIIYESFKNKRNSYQYMINELEEVRKILAPIS